MAPMRAAAQMQQVEILEDDLDSAPAALTSGADPVLDAAVIAAVRAALRRWWFVPVLLAVGIGVGAVQLERADAARSDRIAAVPGMVRPLTDAPHALWTAPAPAGGDELVALDALVLLGHDAGSWRVTASDVRTGDRRWSVPIGPAPSAGTEKGAATCLHPTAGQGAVVVCTVVPPTPVFVETGTQDVTPPVTTVVALDGVDGTRLGEWSVAEQVLSVQALGDDVLVATVDADTFVTVSRRDPTTGVARWSYRTTEPTTSLGPAVVEVSDDVVVITEASTVVLDPTDGREVFSATALRFVLARPVGHGFGTWELTRGVAQLHDAATAAVRFDLRQFPVTNLVDDGSVPGVLVLDEGRALRGHDAVTGAQLWRTPMPLDPVAVVDHRIVVTGASDVGVMDAGTGAVLWTRSTGGPPAWTPLSDGSLVLVSTTTDTGAVALTAYGLSDGVQAWSVPLPDGLRDLRVESGHLLLVTSEDVQVLS